MESTALTDSPVGPRRGHRIGRIVPAVILAAMVSALSPTAVIAAETDDEVAFVEAVNEVRADLGLEPLASHDELADAARTHAEAMAAAGEIFHADPISAGLTAEWQKLGENVGVGAAVQVLMDAFIASPGHYANIIDPSFSYIGVGVVRDGDALYTTHRFLQPPIEDGSKPSEPHGDGGDGDGDDDDEPAGSRATPNRIAALFGLLDSVG